MAPDEFTVFDLETGRPIKAGHASFELLELEEGQGAIPIWVDPETGWVNPNTGQPMPRPEDADG